LDEALSGVTVRAPRGVLEKRYGKEVRQLLSEIDRGEKKLGNESFVSRAAPEIVAKEREKLQAYRSELARVEAALRALKEPA
jgi:valyl-tRNA synthetase